MIINWCQTVLFFAKLGVGGRNFHVHFFSTCYGGENIDNNEVIFWGKFLEGEDIEKKSVRKSSRKK